MLRHLGDKMPQNSAKMSQDGAQERQEDPIWAKKAPQHKQDGQLDSMLGAILAHLIYLGANFNENVKKQKTFKKLKVF